jgi:hypothetical protein
MPQKPGLVFFEGKMPCGRRLETKAISLFENRKLEIHYVGGLTFDG